MPDTHRRLTSAHRLWHQTLKVYSNPDAFRTNLNATIQELRNVTFILQKEQHRLPEFATWYRPHQERLRSDPLLRWLVEARNTVVKQGDLETNSTATVSLVDGYVDRPSFTTAVPPHATAKQIAAAFAARAPVIGRHAYLLVERRWEVGDLPGHELLDVLAYCYARLEVILADAHQLMGNVYRPADCSAVKNHPLGRTASCMSVARESRLARVELSSGAFANTRRRRVNRSPKVQQVARERYGEFDATALTSENFEDKARELHRMARVIITKDPELLTTVQLYKNGTVVHVATLLPVDATAKYALWRDVAAAVEGFGADAVIANVEAWVYPLDQPGRRVESVQTLYEGADGKGLSLTSIFRREGGEVILDDPCEEPDTRGVNVFEPIRTVWRRRTPSA